MEFSPLQTIEYAVMAMGDGVVMIIDGDDDDVGWLWLMAEMDD